MEIAFKNLGNTVFENGAVKPPLNIEDCLHLFIGLREVRGETTKSILLVCARKLQYIHYSMLCAFHLAFLYYTYCVYTK
jgi:hypothetical protein